MADMHVPFYRHDLDAGAAQAVADVLATPFLTTGGVARGVEAQMADYFDLPHAALCNSWTNGALAMLLAMDIRQGSEVILPAMTFIATANVVELAGATPVFAECDPETLLMEPTQVLPLITPATRAVMPVHMYGQMCDIKGLRDGLDAMGRDDIRIIEDCAHCFEGKRDGYRPGTHSDAAIFSFYATKNVTCGEGGGVVMRDADLHQNFLQTRLHGMSAIAVDRFAGGSYNHWDMARLGTKANLPDLLAALLPDQIRSIDARLPRRLELAQTYRAAFADGPLRLAAQRQDCLSAEHIFPIGIPGGPAARDRAIAALNAAGVQVTVNYRSVPSMIYYREKYGHDPAVWPEANAWGDQTLTLPFFPAMSEAEQTHVIEAVKTHVYPLAEAGA